MKKTTLALSIITAFGLWGCVGSSSGDDQPIDQGHSQQQHHINPSQNTDDNNNNNGNSGNAGSTGGSAGGASGHISGGSAGGQPIADNDSSDDETGGNDDNDNDDNDNGSDAIPTVAEATATLDKITKELAEKNVEKSFLEAELTAMKGLNQKAQQDLTTAKNGSDEATIAAAQAAADKTAAAEAAAQAKVDAAENEITKLTTEKTVAATGVKISQAKEDFEPQSKIDALRAQQASTKADAAKTAANKIKSAADTALTEITKKVTAKEEEVEAAQRKYDSDINLDNQNALIKAQEELATLKAQQAEAQKKATDAESDYNAKNEKATQATAELTAAKELDKKRAVASTFSTPADREVFADIAKAEKSDTGIWTITFKDGTPLVINPVEINSKTGYLGNGDEEYIGRILSKGDGKYAMAVAYENSLYGYSDDKFFAVGYVTNVDNPLTGEADYKGHALLQSADNNTNLVSKLNAHANFGRNVLTGNFSEFKSYQPDEAAKSTPPKGGILTPYTELSNPVSFMATINGNRFEAAKAPGQANVYGYFYGNQAGEMGGLVQHEKFHGAFGAKQSK